MNNKLLRLLGFCVFAGLPALASAAGFTGTFQASMDADYDIFDGVQLTHGTGTVTVANGIGANDLDLSFSLGSLSVSVPLVASGNVAALAAGTHTVGTTTVLDAYLFSDGNNMSLAYIARDQSTNAISFALSAWQQTPSFADAGSAVGRWEFTSVFGDLNLRDLTGRFEPKFGWFNIDATGGGYAIVVPQVNLNVPLTIAQGNISLASPPAPAGSGLWQVLGWTYDQGKGALFVVGNGVNDPSDVSITLGLVTQAVPEPETWATMLAGLGLLGAATARRKSIHS